MLTLLSIKERREIGGPWSVYFLTLINPLSPLQQRLESFGDIMCLVAGQYAEVSQDTH